MVQLPSSYGLVCGATRWSVCFQRGLPRLVLYDKCRIAVQPYKADLCHYSCKQRRIEVQHIPLSISLVPYPSSAEP